jgi:hypothetical protein
MTFVVKENFWFRFWSGEGHLSTGEDGIVKLWHFTF